MGKKMWTRGKDKNEAGKFSYTLYSSDGAETTVGSFDTAQAADRAAEVAQRIALFGALDDMSNGDFTGGMSDEDLLRELLA